MKAVGRRSIHWVMKLFYSPGACSLSPHIALREAELPFTLERVDLRAKTTASGADYRAINPKGYVPALELEDGTILTEGAVMVQWIADRAPGKKLAPPHGTIERVRLQEWLHYIATELHKGMSPLYNKDISDAHKRALLDRLTQRYDFLGKAVASQAYLLGDTFTIADGYAFYCLRAWQVSFKQELGPELKAYFARIAERPTVKAALAAEGLT